MTEEEIVQMAPGLMQALAPEEVEESPNGRPRRRKTDDPMSVLRKWFPYCLFFTSVSSDDLLCVYLSGRPFFKYSS